MDNGSRTISQLSRLDFISKFPEDCPDRQTPEEGHKSRNILINNKNVSILNPTGNNFPLAEIQTEITRYTRFCSSLNS